MHSIFNYNGPLRSERACERFRKKKKTRGIIKIQNALISYLNYSFTITNRESIWRGWTMQQLFFFFVNTYITNPNEQKRPDEYIFVVNFFSFFPFLFFAVIFLLWFWPQTCDPITCFFACIHLSGKSFSFISIVYAGKWMANSCRRMPL